MRLIIKKDLKITSEELDELQRQFTDLIYENTGITPIYYVEEHNFENVPTTPDADGDLKPTDSYYKTVTDDIYKRYNEFGTDHIILLVHEDNWIFKGIWGTNLSNIYHSYHIELCRFDKRNIANSLGILYHEVMHSFDALVKTTIKASVHIMIGMNWDKFIVHGGRPDQESTTKWKYIRYKENTEALRIIAPLLIESYAKRQELHDAYTKGLWKQIVLIAQALLLLWRKRGDKKNGFPRTS